MLAFSYNVILFAGLIVAMYVTLCAHVARRAGHMGLSVGKWLVLSLLLTPIPAVIVLWRRNLDSLGESQHGRFRELLESSRDDDGGIEDKRAPAAALETPRRCPHCQRPLFGCCDPAGPPDIRTCPHCGMMIDEERLA